MTAALDRVMDNIDKLDLNGHIAELEVNGFTTIKGVLSEAQIERAKQAIIARVEEKSGKSVDLETGAGYEGGWRYVPHLLYDDEVFEDILMEPKSLALLTYLLGESCLLSSVGCHFKGPGGEPLLLHSDNANGLPQPFPCRLFEDRPFLCQQAWRGFVLLQDCSQHSHPRQQPRSSGYGRRGRKCRAA